jgi:adenylate cyclase
VTERLSLEDLARWTGETPERIKEWRALGLIGRGGEGFSSEDLELAGLIQLLLRRGISIESIAEAARDLGPELASYIRLLFPEGVPRAYRVEEAATLAGLDPDAVRRLLTSVWPGRSVEWVAEDDVTLLQTFKFVLDSGFPESTVIDLLRVYSDALTRVAEAETRLASFFAPGGAWEGQSEQEAVEAYRLSIERLMPLAAPVVDYFHRKALLQASRLDVARSLAERFGLAERPPEPGQLEMAVAFIDLSSFTPMTAEMGDRIAADVLTRFSAIVREAAYRHDGSVVKQIGDAFMLVFPQAASAVSCLLDVDRRAAQEPQFPALRGGIAFGLVLYREGDYVGSLVNVASRLADAAERHQVLITPEVRREAAGLPDVEFAPVGKRRLKGIADELEVFAVRPAGAEAAVRVLDPVCGMELGPGEVAVSLTLDGIAHSFCSEDCLRKFVASPERYKA